MPTRTRPVLPAPAADDRRALALVAVRGGLAAALVPLVVLMLLGVIGWFLTDGGIHGTASDGLRTGALAWLLGHGSGVQVRGSTVSALPLALTAAAAYAAWRAGLRTGEQLSDHGPDAVALSDGDRDWTVPVGAAVFAASYVVPAVLVGVLAGTAATQPSLAGVLLWSLVIAGGVGGAAIAVGSGRAAVWLDQVPLVVREAARTAVWLLGAHLSAAAVLFVVSLLVDGGAALSVLSRLHTDVGGGVLVVLVSLLLVPNAVVFAGSYLLGPGFQVGTGTVVSPTAVALGPVPMFPLLAALPDNGPTPAWTPFLIAVPPLLAAWAAVRAHRRRPTVEWETGALRGLCAGVFAAALFALLAVVAGGSVGPGRMAEVGPLAGAVLFQGIVAFGIGGLVGGLVATWRARRDPEAAPEAAPMAEEPADEEPVEDRMAERADDEADREPTIKLPGIKLPGPKLPGLRLPGLGRSSTAGTTSGTTSETTSEEGGSDR